MNPGRRWATHESNCFSRGVLVLGLGLGLGLGFGDLGFWEEVEKWVKEEGREGERVVVVVVLLGREERRAREIVFLIFFFCVVF